MKVEDYRISKLRNYLIEILNSLLEDNKYVINANMLDKNPNNYSINRIPTMTKINSWIIGTEEKKDVYSFRSRMEHSSDVMENLKNIGFFEEFENLIYKNNREKNFPDIENIESIECLDCGSLININTNTAIFNVQIQITYLNQ